MLSAHWEDQPVLIGATRTVPLVYDFYGFPERYYETKYPAPAAPHLAERVRALLAENRIAGGEEPERGLDHGAFVPLIGMYPDADVPVLQISLGGLDERRLFALGRALAPLREEGVLIFGSGFLVHNMRYAFKAGTPPWAKAFDAWCEETIAERDWDALVEFQKVAPSPEIALPTWEHFAPVIVAAGAVADEDVAIRFPITGWWMGSAFTKRSVQFG
jgi:4,5-DOPA dioxygenase extradiol